MEPLKESSHQGPAPGIAFDDVQVAATVKEEAVPDKAEENARMSTSLPARKDFSICGFACSAVT